MYGEDDNEFAVPLQDGEDEHEAYEETLQDDQLGDQPATNKTEMQPTASNSIGKSDAHSLPAKPGSAADQAASQLSYSAQIARQFSGYNQTPSQERQQRAEIPLPPNPNAHAASANAGPSAIATHEGAIGHQVQDRPVRPSEMKDEG